MFSVAGRYRLEMLYHIIGKRLEQLKENNNGNSSTESTS